ncbi:MAG: hypothetical protein ACYCVD_05295 [Desulfitobacteriaceae bacterium]
MGAVGIIYDELLQQYTALPKISFDYEVVEKAEHIVVLRYDGDWKDLGTWNTLTEEMPNGRVGNAIVSSTCVRCTRRDAGEMVSGFRPYGV